MYSGCDPFACSTHNEVIRCWVPVCYVSQPPPRPSVVVLATKTRFPTEWSRVVPTGPQFVPVDFGHRRRGGVCELPSHAHSCLAQSNRSPLVESLRNAMRQTKFWGQSELVSLFTVLSEVLTGFHRILLSTYYPYFQPYQSILQTFSGALWRTL